MHRDRSGKRGSLGPGEAATLKKFLQAPDQTAFWAAEEKVYGEHWERLKWLLTRRILAKDWGIRPWEIEEPCPWVPYFEILLELDIRRVESETAALKRR